jgi:hypothetical protein
LHPPGHFAPAVIDEIEQFLPKTSESCLRDGAGDREALRSPNMVARDAGSLRRI